jgi:hypothetical protein
MARQNGFSFYALIGKKVVSRLRISAVRSHEGDGLPHRTGNLSKQLSKPLEEPNILKLAFGEFSVKARLHYSRLAASMETAFSWRCPISKI